MNDKRLFEIEERLNRATDGPWVSVHTYDCVDNSGRRLQLGNYVYTKNAMAPYLGLREDVKKAIRNGDGRRLIAKIDTLETNGFCNSTDGEFIANARQDVEDLLQYVKQLKALLS